MAKKTWAAGESLLASDLNNNFSRGWNILADVNLLVAAASLASGTIAGYDLLKIGIYVPGLSASSTLRLRFNGDSLANYEYNLIKNDGSSSPSTSQTSILLDNTGDTSPRLLKLDILNRQTAAKKILLSGIAGLDHYRGAGTWNDTDDQITSASLFPASGNLNAGTRMIIEGFSS